MPGEKQRHADRNVINVAETCVGTRALGPGLRSVVWVQGCPLHCPGCVAPNWIPQRVARLAAPGDLAAELLADGAVSGLTLSGGEPMLQAAPLAAMVRIARRARDVSVICYSGHTLQELRERPPAPVWPSCWNRWTSSLTGATWPGRTTGGACGAVPTRSCTT